MRTPITLTCLSLALATPLAAQDGTPPIDQLGKDVERLSSELEAVRRELAEARQREADARAAQDAMNDALLAEVADLASFGGGGDDGATGASFGGYGEFHANLPTGGGKDVFDLHRFVFYAGYAFDDWIRLESETEIEHAYVNDGDGEVSIEQLFVEFDVADDFRVRTGRVLVPMGIINQVHEPPTFRGVERPNVEKYVLPTTWSGDGVGVDADVSDCAAWQLYVVGGMDGAGFDSKNGIRGGRIKERPSANELAVTGRVDFWPLASSDSDAEARVGASFFTGGVDNANKGGASGADADLLILAADAQASYGRFDLRAVAATGDVDGAADLNAAFGNDVGGGFGGWYVEAGVHCLPESWREGRLANADAIFFARYEEYDTQLDLPTGAASDPASGRDELTFGLDFFFTPNLVAKVDFQVLDDGTADGRNDQLNLGIGWMY
jgi:hypothetical protein